MHASVQAVLQQTPPLQNPDAHSSPRAHVKVMRRRQLPFVQGTLMQSPSLAQVVRQRSPAGSHVNGTQTTAGAARQLPMPSQSFVPVTTAFAHVPDAHGVPTM
jgi:hypothetical protein